MKITAYDLAQRFVGQPEIAGTSSNPLVLAMLRLEDPSVQDDAVPWCSAFVNFVCWLLRVPRSKSLSARSWLAIGRPIPLIEARPGWDVVVFSRGTGQQPGPEVLKAPGHVAFYAGAEGGVILALGGNQGDVVNVSRYPMERLLGVRRLYEEA